MGSIHYFIMNSNILLSSKFKKIERKPCDIYFKRLISPEWAKGMRKFKTKNKMSRNLLHKQMAQFGNLGKLFKKVVTNMSSCMYVSIQTSSPSSPSIAFKFSANIRSLFCVCLSTATIYRPKK